MTLNKPFLAISSLVVGIILGVAFSAAIAPEVPDLRNIYEPRRTKGLYRGWEHNEKGWTAVYSASPFKMVNCQWTGTTLDGREFIPKDMPFVPEGQPVDDFHLYFPE